MTLYSGSHSDHLHFTQQDCYSWSSDSIESSMAPDISDSAISSSCKHINLNFQADVLLASENPKKRAGRIKFRETRHPVYRGVRLRNSGKWVCELREPNKKSRIWLGTFLTAEMAARAHDVAVIALRGRSACLNFADSAWRLPVPASTDAKDIQRAAAEAAEIFRPKRKTVEEQSMQREEEVSQPCDGVGGGMSSEKVGFLDDESIFDMPGLLSGMAEALMIPPPIQYLGRNYDVAEECADVSDSLWGYS